jgi:hypothetical protein
MDEATVSGFPAGRLYGFSPAPGFVKSEKRLILIGMPKNIPSVSLIGRQGFQNMRAWD